MLLPFTPSLSLSYLGRLAMAFTDSLNVMLKLNEESLVWFKLKKRMLSSR